jgi:hypothetical protein
MVQKSLKTPLCNIKMAPNRYISDLTYIFPLRNCLCETTPVFQRIRVSICWENIGFALKNQNVTILAVPVNNFSMDAIEYSNLKILTLTTQFISLQQIPCSCYTLIAIFSSDILLTCTNTIRFTESSTSIASCKVENKNLIIFNMIKFNQKRRIFKINSTG